MLLEKDLGEEVAAFMQERERLVREHSAPWVLFAEGKFQKAFDDYSSAVAFAIKSGWVGRFLVRNLNAEVAQVPLVFVREPA